MTPRELRLSLTADDEMHLMLALIQYRATCRDKRKLCPPMLERVVAQLSRRVTEGQEGSTFDVVSQDAHDQSMSSPPPLVTYAEGARLLTCSVSTLKRRIRSGALEPVQISERGVRLRRTDIERLIENGAA